MINYYRLNDEKNKKEDLSASSVGSGAEEVYVAVDYDEVGLLDISFHRFSPL